MMLHRRDWLRLAAAGLIGTQTRASAPAVAAGQAPAPLKITGLKVTPIALPDPPLLNKSGCHGPYFLRNVVEIETDGQIVGIGETTGGQRTTDDLERARAIVLGRDAFAYRALGRELRALGPACYAAIEQACLDACGRA